MIEKVMIQLGPKKIKRQRGVISSSAARPHGTSEDSITGKLIAVKRQPKNLKSSCHMMIEKVMIQLGVCCNRKGVGGGHQRGTCDAEDAGSQGQKQLGKQTMRKAKARKPPKATKPKSQRNWQAKERNCECRGCEMKSHKSQKAEKPPTLKNKNNS